MFVLDLQHIGLLHPSINSKDIIIDKSKIGKKARVKVTNHQNHVQSYKNFICIGVARRVDKDALQYKQITKKMFNFFLEKQRTKPITFIDE